MVLSLLVPAIRPTCKSLRFPTLYFVNRPHLCFACKNYLYVGGLTHSIMTARSLGCHLGWIFRTVKSCVLPPRRYFAWGQSFLILMDTAFFFLNKKKSTGPTHSYLDIKYEWDGTAMEKNVTVHSPRGKKPCSWLVIYSNWPYSLIFLLLSVSLDLYTLIPR